MTKPTEHAVYLLYKLAEVISCQQQIVWLKMKHHENIHKLRSLRFLKLNLEYQNIKLGGRTYELIHSLLL